MKQEINWEMVSIYYDPLEIIDLIEKTVLDQTEDPHPFEIMHEQELSLYGFQQNNLTSNQWYEKFNNEMDVGNEIGVTRQYEVLLEWNSQQVYNKESSELQDSEQETTRVDAEERYLTYIFLKQITKTSNKLKTDISDNYTTVEKNPVTRQETFHYLEKHSKSIVCASAVL